MVTVCMATYNGARHIKEQLDSILSQLGNGDELIVSDDGSSDTTLEIIGAYHDPRIKTYDNSGRKGIIGNFENALVHAQGDYIFLADQDDVWHSDKVTQCVQGLQNADLVLHDATVVNAEKEILAESFFHLHGSRRGFWKNLWRNSYLGCCLAFRREMLDYILPIPPIAMHDIWIGLIVSRKGRVQLIHKQLILYRRHGENASSTSEKSKFTIRKKISYRIKMLYYSIIR